MPLRNRVRPDGEIIETPERGAWMGNRGGCFHTPARTLAPRRRWAGRAWLVCRLEFRGRHRVVMRPGRYTELFFLDEATALAAGHRPCAECRRADFDRFVSSWTRAGLSSERPRAADIDRTLHAERGAVTGAFAPLAAKSPVAGMMLLANGCFWLVAPAPSAGNGDGEGPLVARPWSPSGYGAPVQLARLTSPRLLTPQSSVRTIAAGYRPEMHPSALAP
ncbi:MAG: hypothetical protein GC150_00225 [Rhizobiales bacterium]|nr:hypothetical protein [Hyphomicrobiales bacterium]